MRAALARKGAAEVFDAFLASDAAWREKTRLVEELRARTKPRQRPDATELAVLADVKRELQGAEAELAALASRRGELLDRVPNPPAIDVPDGLSDEDARELRRVGSVPKFAFKVRDHLELGHFDMSRGARLSGARFAYRMGDVALVELALYRYALDVVAHKGFIPVLPPVLVRERAMFSTGFLPTDEVNIYRVESDELYLTGTSEVALAALHMDEVVEEEVLPLRYAGYSTCFRREAGAAGRDTRGVFRVHQFDKVEMFVFCDARTSGDEHEAILAIEEEIVQGLGLAYRVVMTAAGDLGPSAAKKYDLEAWVPSESRYREITSCSNTTDFQARRLNARERRDGSLEFMHTLNGTAMTARFLIALLECFQDERGSVAVPEVLVGFGAPARIEGGD